MRTRRGLFAGLFLIAAVNAVILGRVEWNRSGAAQAPIVLTERELSLSSYTRVEEDSGLSLRLAWHGDRFGAGWTHPEWFDREKLGELGFDTRLTVADPGAAKHYRSTLARNIYVVLENEGPAWRRWLANEERKSRERRMKQGEDANSIEEENGRLKMAREMGSRLFSVDAGLDLRELRSRYPDTSRYLILPTAAEAQLDSCEDHPKRVVGYLVAPRIGEIHVPLELRPVLDEVLRQQEIEQNRGEFAKVPQFRALLTTGRSAEPWLVGVERIGR